LRAGRLNLMRHTITFFITALNVALLAGGIIGTIRLREYIARDDDALVDQRQGKAGQFTYRIGEEEIVYQPEDFWVDGPYFTYEWGGQVFGVLPSDKTSRTRDYISPKIRHREAMQGLGLEAKGDWDEIGSWLNGIYRDPRGRLHGYYHGETRERPISPARNRAAMGYAYSDDGGATWTKPGHPQNRIIVGRNGHDYAGDACLVAREDRLSLYFGQWQDGEYVALSKPEDKGLPGTWRTFVRSTERGGPETVTSLQANGSVLVGLRYGAFVTWNTHLKRWLAVDGNSNGEKQRTLVLKVSDDGFRWSRLSKSPPPPLPQTYPKLALYPSLVGIEGGMETDREFWCYYVYLTSPNTLARVKVSLRESAPAPR